MDLRLALARLSPSLILLLACMGLYAGALHAPLVFDDFSFFSSLDNLAQYIPIFFNFGVRWLSYASFDWTIQATGLDIFWLRLGNVLIHAANVIALYFLLRQVFRVTLHDPNPPAAHLSALSWLAFLGALLFAWHPVAVYGVAYLIQRSILMATLFVLLMLLAYLRGLQQNSWQWLLIAALCYFAAVFAKEHSIAAPAVTLALTFLIRKPTRDLFKLIAPYYLLCALIAIIITYTISKIGVIGGTYEPNGVGMVELTAKRQGIDTPANAFILSILTQSTLYFKYLALWLLPNPAWMSVDMREPLAVSYWGWHTAGLALFIAYPIAAIRLLFKQGKKGLLGLALLFPWLLFLTELTTVRAQEPFVLYRSYLWMPGLLFALPALLGKLALNRAVALLGICAILLIPLALNRIHSFSTPLRLWDDAEKLVRHQHHTPGVERIYNNRGLVFAELMRYPEAIADLTTAISIYPGFDSPYCDRATAHFMLGHYYAALRDYDRAISLNTNNPICYNGRGRTYRALGDELAAQQDFAKSCALHLCTQNP